MAGAFVKEGGVIVVQRARLAFPELWSPKAFVDPKTGAAGKAQYSATLIIDRDDAVKGIFRAEEERVAKDKFGDKWQAIFAEILANNRQALKPGELKASYAGYAGNDFVSCNNETKPTLVTQNGFKIETEEQYRQTFYAGCYVLAHVTLWAQNNSWGRRINANITGVQFAGDGDSFGGGAAPAPVEDFADLSAADLMS